MQKAMNDQPIQPGEGILHHAEGVDLIPANIELAGLEVALVNSMNREKMLKQVLDSAKREYDFILLDCMPSLGMLTINALAAADAALIPVQAQYLSAKGLEQLLQTVQKVRRQINPKLKIEGILLTMTDSRTNYGKQISNLIRQAYGKHLKVFDQTIPRSVRAAETSAAGKSIFAYDPKGKVAEAYSHGDLRQPRAEPHGAELPEMPVCTRLSGLSHPHLRGDLRRADTVGSDFWGCHQLHLEHCGLHRSALFQSVQDQLRDEICPRSALKEVLDWLRIFPFPVT